MGVARCCCSCGAVCFVLVVVQCARYVVDLCRVLPLDLVAVLAPALALALALVGCGAEHSTYLLI